ncbi:TetR/AcrR family transcriptional regulator [Persicimonas caeni]|uniref:TetR/AcrR family transcriptional regulator n=1 Tax=Persicimonas caeni TaxID=2292766 RepID=A0A4Y6PQT8_PERCE|nr:TetR/AcrR family transcriptional regulator [Persicimonas caeni]QDG50377.1 TetR/AcrR family transcriptional regulator [Persicimonas caeni]QED31598.1 TetR/AcrR family transcriptional regulator [Persicimonas caeni]
MSNAPKNTPDVRTQILHVATQLFARNGFDGTPLQAISDEVGIAKPSLLYHFPSKEELRRAVLDGVMSHWNEVIPKLLQAATTGEHRFESLINEIVVFFNEDPDRARLLVREMLDRPDEMKLLFQQTLGPWMKILSDYIRRGQEEGIIHADLDPEAYILQIIQLVVGTIAIGDVVESLLDALSDERSPHRRQVDEVIRIARSSLFIEPDPPDQNPSNPDP